MVSPAQRRKRALQIAPDSACLHKAACAAISGRLDELLAQQPRSLAQLGEEAGLGESTIGRLSRGDTEPTLSEMAALVAVFQLRSIEELIAPIGTGLLLEEARAEQGVREAS